MMNPLGAVDNPISSVSDDLLNRASFASLIADEVRSIDASQGAVVGILGPWGVGKTSLLNMVAEYLSEEPALAIIEFNPWLFSDTEQLVATFFEEMSIQLKVKKGGLAVIADDLRLYGETLSPMRFIPMIGPWLDRIGAGGAALGRLIKRHSKSQTSASALRKELEAKLSEIDQHLVVIIDDLDRLTSSEIRDMFKLVRLTASFPNVVFLLAFDRERIENVLNDEGFPGGAYLERILQVSYEVPAPPEIVLRQLFLQNLEQVLSKLETGPFDESLWPDVFEECIWPLIGNIRDAKRYLASLPLTLRHIGAHVALVDLLAVEALRVFIPEVHRLLPETASALTETSPVWGHQDDQATRTSIDRFTSASDSHSDVVKNFCERLFPTTASFFGGSSYGSEWLRTWRRERRLSDPETLTYYLNRVISEGILAARRAEEAFASLGDRGRLHDLFQTLSAEELEATISELEGYEDEFEPEIVEPACLALLEVMPRLRTESRGMMDFGADLVVSRVVLRLLRHLNQPETMLATVQTLFADLSTLYGRYLLLKIVGHWENAGHKLIAEEDSLAIEEQLRNQIASATPEQLVGERDVLRLVWWCTHPMDDGAAPSIAALGSIEVRKKLLSESLTETRSQSMGSRAMQRHKRLHWDVLVEALGDEGEVRDVVQHVRQAEADTKLAEASALARRYLEGWRQANSKRRRLRTALRHFLLSRNRSHEL